MRYCCDCPLRRHTLRFLDAAIPPSRLKWPTTGGMGRIVLLTVGSFVLGCGGPSRAKLPSDLTQVSGSTPFAVGCNGAPQTGTRYSGASVEPYVAIDPNDPSHLLGVWQQDRWSNGGASGLLTGVSHDQGRTWARTFAPLSRCTGGNASNGGDYERASDPWVTFSPDGTAYQISVSFNNSDQGAGKAILVSRSTDGGSTWSDPIALTRDQDVDKAVDKQTITSDPRDARLVYAVWDRLTQLTNPNPAMVSGPTWFARLANDTWEPARIIYDPGVDAQTVSNQIVVLPDGTLVNLFLLITNSSSMSPERRVAIQRSTDKGVTWSAPIVIDRSMTIGVADAKTHQRIRSGAIIPGIAADPVNGRLYVVWQDSRFSNGLRDGIAMSTSIDGGLIWSTPIQLNQSPDTPAFTPAISVSAHGRVGVTYYDFRTDDPGNPNSLLTSYWLVTSEDGGATWEEKPIGEAFDMRTAPVVDGYFVGDYEGLAADGESFVSFFSAATFPHVGNGTEIYFYAEAR